MFSKRTAFLVFCVAVALAADAASAEPERMAPLAFLAGHCWEGEVAQGQRDIQCYDWLYDRQFLRSEHTVIGSKPRYQQYRLAWNARIDERWVVVIQDQQGRAQPIAGVDADEWVWNRAGALALILSKHRSEAEGPGWRMAALRLSGQQPLQGHRERIDASAVRDSSFCCAFGLALCAVTVVEADRSTIRLLWREQTAAESESRLEQFGDGSSEEADPEFSPDGKRILFRSRRSGAWELWEANLDGSEPVQLTADPANDAIAAHHYGGEGPARYSPDGQRIVWTRRFADRGFDIWQMDRNGGNAQNLSADHAGDDSYPSFSPDGRQIAFSSARDGNDEIYLMNADGGEVRRVSFQPGHDLAPLWLLMPK